ncbi:MAG: site-specific integrase [Bacilli bacterium]
MPIYKEGSLFFVKVCINGKQILRRKYLGRQIDTYERALLCERDLYIQYKECDVDYKINDLFNLFEEYLFKKLKETSAKRYLYTFNNVFKKYFENRNVSDITRSYCEFLNDSINNLPYKRIDIYIYVVKLFINFLSNYGCKINTSCFFKYKSSRTLPKKYNYYTYDEFKKLLEACKDDELYTLMFSLLFYYGLRIGELRGLQIKDFKKDRISINKELSNKGRFGGQEIFDPKTSSSYRDYPYVSNIHDLEYDVIMIFGFLPNDYIFAPGYKKVIGETTIRRKLEEYCKIAKIKVIKIHEFRHSCATFLFNQNVDPKDIASWLGHSSVDTTLRVYSHLLPVRKENVKKVFDIYDIKH